MRRAQDHPLSDDLEHILRVGEPLWRQLRGERLFITGGTGFFGTWLLESIAWAHDRLELDLHATVLTRDPAAFARRAPHLAAHPALAFHRGDVCNFAFPAGTFSQVIHAATETSANAASQPLFLFDTIIQGTRRTLEFAVCAGAANFLLTSSGAVYGRQPTELPHVHEDYVGAPSPVSPLSAYGEGKRCAELLCAIHEGGHVLQSKIARCFTFVGPHLPLDKHFAIGNFIRDALRGEAIVVKGDGTPLRSYLHGADLVVWLLKILLHGEASRPYNVGSDHSISIADLARLVASLAPGPAPVKVLQAPSSRAPERYVPSIDRASHELGLEVAIPLGEAIARTLQWAGRSAV